MNDNEYNYYIPGQDYRNEPPKQDDQNKKEKKKMSKLTKTICLALVFGLVASAAFQVSNVVISKALGTDDTSQSSSNDQSESVGNAQLTQTSNSSTQASGVADVVEGVKPCIVSITNMSVQQVQNFFGSTSEQQVESSGSGIIISENDSELLIVTNNHVVEDYSSLTVTFSNEVSVEGIVKGTNSSKDLAVIAVKLDDIDEDTKSAIKKATLGNSDGLQVGEQAIAIGNALGYGQSVTTGVISATNRDIEMQGFDCTLIQTDAAINPGNSGGALLNSNGEVIGINTVKVSDSSVEGMGYAIPISDVKDIIEELMNQETREKVNENKKGYLGIRGVDVTEESAEMYSMPKGVYVSEAIEGGGAEAAGIQKGYIITEFNSESIGSMTELQSKLEYYAAGETVTLTVQVPANNGEYEATSVEVTLTKN